MTRRAALVFLAGCLCASAQPLRPDPRLAKVIDQIRAEVNGAEALDFVVRQHETDRWSDFAHFEQTAAYLDRTMKAIGLRQVERSTAPADGETQFGWWTMPLAWDVKDARLEIIEPAVAADLRVLCDYRQEPASLIMWSGATPPGGVVAEVVEWKPGVEVKGKMVLAEPPLDLGQRGALKHALYAAGAAGLISYTTESPDIASGHYWMNAWGDAGWGFTKTSSPLVGFSITPRQGALLRGLLAGGAKVRVKALAETRYYSGPYSWVTGVIPGTSPEEEVLELGHAFELGAQDNSTGVAGMLEAVAALTRLIEAGRLPRPKRSIRILAMPEDYGSSAYIAGQMDRMKRTIGAINVDTPAGPYDETPGYSFAMNPDVNRSYQDALMMRVAETYYAAIPRRFPRWIPYRATSDSYLSDPMIGVPTLSVAGSSGAISVHHNSADTLDRVDPRSLRDLGALLAGFLYSLASAGDDEIGWLAGMTVDRSYENTLRAVAGGAAKVDYSADRDCDALNSLLRLASPGKQEQARSTIAGAVAAVRRFAVEQRGRAKPASAPLPDPRRAEAARMVVKRKRFGPVTLDDLPFDRREGFPGFGASPAPLPLLTWCDGKRTLAEVIRLVEFEQGPLEFDFVGYFRFLAKHGYVEILPTPPQ